MLTAQKTTVPAIAAALAALVFMIALALATNMGLFVANIWTI